MLLSLYRFYWYTWVLHSPQRLYLLRRTLLILHLFILTPSTAHRLFLSTQTFGSLLILYSSATQSVPLRTLYLSRLTFSYPFTQYLSKWTYFCTFKEQLFVYFRLQNPFFHTKTRISFRLGSTCFYSFVLKSCSKCCISPRNKSRCLLM